MSFQATAYAAHVCETDDKLSTAARFVLYVMGEGANFQTGEAYAGKTVADRTGYTLASVRRAVRELVTAGHIGVDRRRSGRATRYRFPVQATAAGSKELSTTRSSRTGLCPAVERSRDPAGALPGPAGPRPGPAGPRTGSTGDVQKTARATNAALNVSGEWCTSACDICHGSQWEASTPERLYAVECPNRVLARAAAMWGTR